MRTQTDFAPMHTPEDLALRIPAMQGYKPTNAGIICLCDQTVLFSEQLGAPSMISNLVERVTWLRQTYDPLHQHTMAVVWCAPNERQRSISGALITAAITSAPFAIPDLDTAILVDWAEGTWVSSGCEPGSDAHPFSRDVDRPPGQRIYDDQIQWMEQFRPVWLELDVAEDNQAQGIVTRMAAENEWARRFVVEVATDPRGVESAVIAALSENTSESNYTSLAGLWLANGWNVDNLVDISARTRNPYLATAIALTMAADGFLRYAEIVTRLSLPTPDTEPVRGVMLSDDVNLIEVLVGAMHEYKEQCVLDPNPESEVD